MTTADYAQHFTPCHAVDLAYDLIGELYPRLRDPHLIDPACGEGAFLFRALERGVTTPGRAIGIERDLALARRAFGRTDGPRAAVADALAGLAAPAAPGAFDLVIANPPYGTGAAGLREISQGEAARVLAHYDLWAIPRSARPRTAPERLRSYPAEVLFLELCVSLARAGGHIAILLPEGLVANARYASVRGWMLANLQLDAVIGLPKSTFCRTGAAAKTVLLLMTRRLPSPGHRILLGAVGDWGQASERVDGSRPQAPDCPTGAVGPVPCLRAVLDFVTHQPQSNPQLLHRLDPSYWHPSHEALLSACRWPTAPLGGFIRDLTYGPIVTGREAPSLPGGVPIVNQGQVRFCGVDLTDAPRVPLPSPWVSPRSMLRAGDVVLPRSGEGSLGRHRVAVFLGDEPAGVGSFVDLVRLRGVSPFYVAAFLKSHLGRAQVSRVANGVGVPNISFDEIRSLRLPLLPPSSQQAIEGRYRRNVLPLHRQAVARHAQLRSCNLPPREDAELARLRETGEGLWRQVISDLDALLLGS